RPPLAVGRGIDVERGRVVVGIPVDDHAAVLAGLAEIDDQPLLLGRGLAPPATVLAVEHAIRLVVRHGRRRSGALRLAALAGDRALLEGEIVDPDRAAPALTGLDRELDRTHLRELLVG